MTRDNMGKDITTIRIATARIEEHLKQINGSIARHETEINKNSKDIIENKMGLVKLTVIVSMAGATGGAVSHIIFELIKKTIGG